MIHFEYHKKNTKTLEMCKVKYPWILDLGLSDESREARYYLLEYLSETHQYQGILEKTIDGMPKAIEIKGDQKIYWSLSHSREYIAYIISDLPTGIDIAENTIRDTSLLDTHSEYEYTHLGGRNWENFYLLWTAKESIIKCIGGTLEDMYFIKFRSLEGEHTSKFEYKEQSYTIKTIHSDSIIISYIFH